jgi:hypothetical protein
MLSSSAAQHGWQMHGRDRSFAPRHVLLQLLSMLCVGSPGMSCIIAFCLSICVGKVISFPQDCLAVRVICQLAVVRGKVLRNASPVLAYQTTTQYIGFYKFRLTCSLMERYEQHKDCNSNSQVLPGPPGWRHAYET